MEKCQCHEVTETEAALTFWQLTPKPPSMLPIALGLETDACPSVSQMSQSLSHRKHRGLHEAVGFASALTAADTDHTFPSRGRTHKCADLG